MKLSQVKSGGMLYRGDYSGSEIYYKNNTVAYLGDVYLCILQTSGNLPTNTTYWAVLPSESDIVVATTGTGTHPSSFTLTSDGNTITLNKPT